jgi:hypothetical protein
MASRSRRREVATCVLFACFGAASRDLRAQDVPLCVASSNGVRMVTGAP